MNECVIVIVTESAVLAAALLIIVGTWIGICCGCITFEIGKKAKRYRKFANDEEENTHRKDRRSQNDTNSQEILVENRDSWNQKRLEKLEDIEKKFEEQCRQLEALREDLRQERTSMATLRTDLKNEKEEKEDALKRLSAIMSSRLRDGNPNVVDLSDQNRPIKVGKQFSELYDNQWTDAYGAVETCVGQDMQEPQIIAMLMDILEQCFMVCKDQAELQLTNVESSVTTIASMVTSKATKLPDDLMQRIKEERKMFAADKLPAFGNVAQQIKEHFSTHGISADFVDTPAVEMFLLECLKLCWLMAIQDPPMAIVSKPDAKAGDNFKAYKHKGIYVAFVVWPALLLEENGPLIMKGVAEFRD